MKEKWKIKRLLPTFFLSLLFALFLLPNTALTANAEVYVEGVQLTGAASNSKYEFVPAAGSEPNTLILKDGAHLESQDSNNGDGIHFTDGVMKIVVNEGDTAKVSSAFEGKAAIFGTMNTSGLTITGGGTLIIEVTAPSINQSPTRCIDIKSKTTPLTFSGITIHATCENDDAIYSNKDIIITDGAMVTAVSGTDVGINAAVNISVEDGSKVYAAGTKGGIAAGFGKILKISGEDTAVYAGYKLSTDGNNTLTESKISNYGVGHTNNKMSVEIDSGVLYTLGKKEGINGTLNQTGGLVSSNGEITLAGSYTLTEDMIVTTGQSLTVQEGGVLSLGAYTLTNQGTLTISSHASLDRGTGTLINEGTMVVSDGVVLDLGANRVVNTGIINFLGSGKQLTGLENSDVIGTIQVNGVNHSCTVKEVTSYEKGEIGTEHKKIGFCGSDCPIGRICSESEAHNAEGDDAACTCGTQTILTADHIRYLQNSMIYNGLLQTPKVRVVVDGRELVEQQDYILTYSGTTVKEGGMVSVNVLPGRAATGSATKSFSIQPREIIVSGITAVDKEYDGNTAAELDFSQVVYDWKKAAYHTEAGKGKIEGDDLTITATGSFATTRIGSQMVAITDLALEGEDKDNYVLAAEEHQVTTTATIHPKAVHVAFTSEGSSYGSVTPVEATLEQLVPEDTVEVVLTYSGTAYDGTEYPDSSIPPEKAGSYSVKASILEESNYVLEGETSTAFMIEKAVVAVPVIQGKKYTGEVQIADVADTEEYTVVTNEGGSQTGSYEVVLRLRDSYNYQWADSTEADITLSFTITNEVNEWLQEPAITDWIYGETPSVPTYQALYHNDKVTVAYRLKTAADKDYTQTVPTAAGEYLARFYVAGTENYAELQAQKEFTIHPKMVVIQWETTPLTYNGKVQLPAAIATGLVEGDECRVITEGAKTEAGTGYTAIATGLSNSNYQLPDNGSTTVFSIGKASQNAPEQFTLTFTVNADGKTYTATIPVVEGAEYSFDGENYSQTNTKTDCTPETEYTGYIRYAQTENYFAGTPVLDKQKAPKISGNTQESGDTQNPDESEDSQKPGESDNTQEPGDSQNPGESGGITGDSSPTMKPWIFTDVEQIEKHWKYENVKYVYDRNLMGAVGGTTLFQPDRPLNRAMFATVLYRMAGEPVVEYTAKFKDVEAGKWYSNAILWANQKGIVQGYSDGSYGINDNITREQIAKMLYLYGEVQKYDVSGKADLNSFTDKKSVSGWATGFIQWAVDAGMISGKPNEDGSYRLDPKGEATRAECAKMLSMFLQKYQ